ncbi:hypothetical protein [Flavivirga rizhaonensis]|uniref:Exo-alpha-sialidase n=1 Tax=Flavivirga rizhaonensis TaxID=2559571 RepID=A0A4S1DWQ2_9FLAO|nr:hypothetical protein [Flavivirga rizhaonensis]TGV02547.1 hypothetical protein EM932_10240 [Flavivirga rizhaonensis]
MKHIKNSILILTLILGVQNVLAQDSKYLHLLVDSIPNGKPVLVNFDVEKGYMATERIAISKNGKSIYYGVRNGYATLSKPDALAHIMKIEFNKGKWSKPQTIFADSSGAPALSRNEKILYFQYEDTIAPQGLYSKKTRTGWAIPKVFKKTIEKSHYWQSPKEDSHYYSAGIKENKKIQDVFHVVTTKSDTLIKRLGFNVKGDWSDFYVSPDESFLILLFGELNKGGAYTFHGNSNLFISFKRNNNTWTTPVNLGKEVHSISKWNWGPYVTKDKKYLFFSSWGETVGTYMIDFKPIYNRLKLASENKQD